MTEKRLFAGWLRSLTGLVAAAGILALSACGGGSGAPNNFFKSVFTVNPSPATAYSGVPSALTITGGAGPFRAFSSNPGVLPIAQTVPGRTILLLANNVDADTDVIVTVQDLGPLQSAAPQVQVTVTVRAAPLLNSLTITPNLADCGTSVCSGQTATATVTVTGPQGGPLAGHAIRFDVIGSAYAIVSNNPAQPLVTSLTVFSDSSGKATVIIKANVDAPTQFAQLSVTDLTSGQTLIGNFVIVQVTDGTQIMTVIPSDVTIKGATKGSCSSGFPTDYYIFGGTPPYRVTSTFPASITLVNSTVNANGGFFEAITNGACVDPLTFTIKDATGRVTTATLHNVEGTEEPPAPSDLAISPASYTQTVCLNSSFAFGISGGTPNYSVTAGNGGGAVPVTPSSGGAGIYTVGPITGASITTVFVKDQSTPQKTITASITCSG